MTSQSSSMLIEPRNPEIDGYPCIEAEDGAMSEQHDPDSLRTHVTETQFDTQMEIDDGPQISVDDALESVVAETAHINRPSQITETQHEVSHHGETEPVQPRPRFVSRSSLLVNEPQGFSFAPAAKPAMDMSRKFGLPQGQGQSHCRTSTEIANRSCTRLAAEKLQVELEEEMLLSKANGDRHETHVTNNLHSGEKKEEPNNASLGNLLSMCMESATHSSSSQLLPSGIRTEATTVDLIRDPTPPHSETSSVNKAQIFSQKKQFQEILPPWSAKVQVTATQHQQVLQQGNSQQSHLGPNGSYFPARDTRAHPTSVPNQSHTTVHATPHTASKSTRVHKKPRVSRSACTSRPPAQLTEIDAAPSQEDLLTVLLFRTRQEKKARDATKALQHAREAELENAISAYEVLRGQVKTLSERERDQRVRLAKHDKLIPDLKVRYKKLQDFVAGLSNDHNRLRDDANVIQEQQKALQADRADVWSAIGETRMTLDHTEIKAAKHVTGAKQIIDQLEQRLDEQSSRNKDNINRILAEQERSRCLERELSTMSVDQKQILDMLGAQRQVAIEVFDKLLKVSSGTRQVTTSHQGNTGNLRDDCVELLAEVKTIESATIGDLQQLDDSFRTYAEKFSKYLDELKETSKASRMEQLKFKGQVQNQLEELQNSITSEQDNSEQIANLREVKATLQERAQASENELAKTRQTVLVLQGREQSLVQEICNLKAEALSLRARPVMDPAMNLRLYEVECRNKELQTELTRLTNETSQQSGQLQRSHEATEDSRKQVSALTSQLEEAKIKVTTSEGYAASCEAQAKAKYESLRRQVLEAANSERAILVNEHLSVLQETEKKKGVASRRIHELEKEVAESQKIRVAEVEASNRTQEELASFQSQTREKDGQIAQLCEERQRLQENIQSQSAESQLHEEQKLSSERSLQQLEARLEKKVLESKCQDAERLSKVNKAVKLLNPQGVDNLQIDLALDYLLLKLEEVNERKPQTPMLDDSEFPVGQEPGQHVINTQTITGASQELSYGRAAIPQPPTNTDQSSDVSQELPYGHETTQQATSMNYGTAVPQELPYGRETKTLRVTNTEHGNGASKELPFDRPTTTRSAIKTPSQRASGERRSVSTKDNKMVIEESQVEETTIRRNLVTTRSSHGTDGRFMPLRTPTHKSPAMFSHFDDEVDLLTIESPNYDMEGLFPPTPIPSSKIGNIIRPSYLAEQAQSSYGSFEQTQRSYVQSLGNSSHVMRIPSNSMHGSFQHAVAAPRGVTKPPRKNKRTIENFGMTPVIRASKRQPSAARLQGLGPIIPDSQSPSKNAGTRGSQKARKSSRRASEDKFTRRFNEHH